MFVAPARRARRAEQSNSFLGSKVEKGFSDVGAIGISLSGADSDAVAERQTKVLVWLTKHLQQKYPAITKEHVDFAAGSDSNDSARSAPPLWQAAP